jgi:hypothetical protein
MITNPLLNKALRDAAKLQRQYTAIGSNSTQNIRNPFPLHVLAQMALPTLSNPRSGDIVKTTVVTRFTYKGKKYVTRKIRHEFASQVIPAPAQTGKTAVQVFEMLQTLGFIVKKSSVAQTLCNLRCRGKISSIIAARNDANPGYCHPNSYFLTEK